MKKKIIGIVISVLLVFVLVVGGVYASKNMSFFQWGGQMAEMQSKQSTSTTIATVNGVEIPKSRFDSYKIGLANSEKKFTDAQILDKLIQQEIIMQEITRLGYVTTDSEVDDFNEQRFSLLNDDPTAYQIVKDYVDGLGITMDEYKEMSKEISRVALLTNKYKSDMLKEFEKQDSSVQTYSQNEKTTRFEEYFNNKIEMLKKGAHVEIEK